MTPAPLDVLIVEDDDGLREILKLHISGQGWPARAVGDGKAALAACAERLPDVVILDVMLPGISGIDVCLALRAQHHPSPAVLMLTARDAEADVVLGLDSGADDYVAKPVRPKELIARVRALVRRAGGQAAPAPSRPPPPPQAILRGPISIDVGTRRVTVGAEAVRLTPTEFSLLSFLARDPDRVHPRSELLEVVWGTSHQGYARNVDCHVTRLRRKLEAAGLDGSVIETSHGAGYRFVTPR
jgi:two-component system response regulator MtrA